MLIFDKTCSSCSFCRGCGGESFDRNATLTQWVGIRSWESCTHALSCSPFSLDGRAGRKEGSRGKDRAGEGAASPKLLCSEVAWRAQDAPQDCTRTEGQTHILRESGGAAAV